jgi:hypothetical protein
LREATAVTSEAPLLRGGAEPKLDADLDYDDDGTTQDCPKCDSGLMADGTPCPTCKGAGTVPVGKTRESKRISELESLLASTTERLREAGSDVLGSTFAPMTATDGGYEVVLIREGLGNSDDSRYYTKHAVQELVASGTCEGMQAYADHPSLDEEEFLPERSIRDMVGSYTGVKLAESATGLAEARAIFKPVRGPGYEWVESLAEAAVGNRTSKPLVGISLYGAAAGEDRERPNGSFGPMADLVRPTSGDIVTNAGAGGAFVRRLMESARAKRAALDTSQKEKNSMQLSELITKIKESATKLREADTDKKHGAVADELEKLSGEKVDAPEPDFGQLTVERLQESAPTLVATLRESAKAEVKIPASAPEADAALKAENEKLSGELREAKKAVADTDMALSGMKVMREAKVPEEDAEFFLSKFREAGARDEGAMKAVIEAEKAREDRIVSRVRESAGLDFVEGVPGSTGSTGDGQFDLGPDVPKPERVAA